jgi:hypothetical protein
MGTRPSTPDIFSHSSTSQPSSAAESSPAGSSRITPSSRHILPADLTNAVKQLDDQELDRLLAAVIAEQNRRGKKFLASDASSRNRKVEAMSAPLTQGKLNAVRAAFKAGVTPSRIARQFGNSQSDVRKALAGNASKTLKIICFDIYEIR